MSDATQTRTLADGQIELTVVKFESMKAYEMLGRLRQPGSRFDPKFLRDMLSNSSVIRDDGKGGKINIQLTRGDADINNAFRGMGTTVLLEALNFALDVNFDDFFAAAAKLAEQPAAAGAE